MAIPPVVFPGGDISAGHMNEVLRSLHERTTIAGESDGAMMTAGGTVFPKNPVEVGWSMVGANASGEDVPPFSVVEITGYGKRDSGANRGERTIVFTKPRKAGLRNVGIVYRDIPRGSGGLVWFGGIHIAVLRDGDDEATPGSYWTTRRGSWGMQKHTMGEWMARVAWTDAEIPAWMSERSALVTARDNVDPAHAITNWHILPMAARLMDFQDSDVADFVLTDNGNGIISVSTATH